MPRYSSHSPRRARDSSTARGGDVYSSTLGESSYGMRRDRDRDRERQKGYDEGHEKDRYNTRYPSPRSSHYHESERQGQSRDAYQMDRASSSSSRYKHQREERYREERSYSYSRKGGGRRDRDPSRSSSPPLPPPPSSSRKQEEVKREVEVEIPDDLDGDQPDFTPSGLLAKESNQINGTALKYHEPPEAKKPKRKWRVYVFKDGKEIDLLHLSRQSCYLFGRDKAVVDVPLEHTSCSKQHAVLQYRLIVERNEFGDEKRNIKPYLIDLSSANGTTVNKREIPASRYYELKNGDTMQFGGSEREYVLLCED